MPTHKFTPEPTPEEAAALIAAVERFLADTTVPAAISADDGSGWQRTALLEAVGRRDENAVWL